MSSRANYYEFQSAKVAIAMELAKRGWKLFGFHKDESDPMTDYWSPAYWDGIAEKDGFVAVIDCSTTYYSGKEIREYSYNNEEMAMSEKIRSLIERLSEVRQDRGASAAEEETAKRKIEELKAKNAGKHEKVLVIGRYPEYQINPPRMSWHVEKDGTIISKGNGIGKFYDMKYFNKEDVEYNLKTAEKGSYRYEKAEKSMKLYKAFEKLINKIDSAAGCMIGGNGKDYVYENIEVTQFKTERRVVEKAGELKDGQLFVVKSSFSYGISKGYVYRLHEHYGSDGSKHYTAIKLNKALNKELQGLSNRANSFGYLSGSYLEKFKSWFDKGYLSFCEIEEIKKPYRVQKCIKRKVG